METAKWSRINATVTGVLLVHVFIYFTVVSCVIIPWLNYSVPGFLHLLFLTSDTVLALVCYLTAVVADPGSVPEDFAPDTETAAASVVEVKRKSGEQRFCQKCKRHKPPRAHHCRVCQRCVLRMDHHCPWMNNCVGHANYKSFFLFLIYVNAAVLHAMGLLAAHTLHTMRMHAAHRQHAIRTGPQAKVMAGVGEVGAVGSATYSILWAVMQTVCTALTLPLSIGLVLLLGWNLYLLLSNKTTIEYHEGVTARIQAMKSGVEYEHPYNLGLCGNLHAVFGAKPACWCVPNSPAASGTGLAYPTAWDADAEDAPLGL